MQLEQEAALAAAKEPVARCRLPRAEPRVWLGTTLPLRRLLPDRLVVRRAERRGREMWEQNPTERERALAAMEAVVGGTSRSHEVELLAREHLIETKVKEAMFWQPWAVPMLDRDSETRLQAVLDGGRAVILSSSHMGPYSLGLSALSARGRTVFSTVAPWVFEQPQPGYWGRRIARRRTEARARRERLVISSGSFELLRALLEEGELVSVFFSVPGGRRTRFLGKPVMLASGTARLAHLTGALVLPLRSRRAGHRLWLDVGEALDPAGFSGVDELHDSLAAVHESWILELPATVEDPNRQGSWEQSATAEGWSRPEPR